MNNEELVIKVLDLSSDPSETNAALKKRFGEHRIENVSKRLWKTLTPIDLFWEARKVNSDVFVISVDDLAATQDERLLVFLGAVTSSRRFFFLERTSGRVKRISRIECGFVHVPFAIFDFIATLLFVALFVPLIFVLRLVIWKRKKSISNAYGLGESFDRVAYLKTDMSLYLKAGGSISHTRGIIKGFKDNGKDILVLSNENVPWLTFDDIPVIALKRTRLFSFLRESERMINGISFAIRAIPKLREFAPEVVYQRQCSFDFSGLLISIWFSIPLVLESNASDVSGLYWDRKRFKSICALVERTLMSGSSLIIAISEPLRETLIELGYPDERIRVLLNGVDCEQFDTPEQRTAGSLLRKELGVFDNDLLVGFVGTFGQWHGIPFLTQAIIDSLGENTTLYYLLIGDGELKHDAELRIREAECADRVFFTGLIEPAAVGSHLAACDILVSPHSKSPDGRKFFGSPTKLFEYMAANRAIVASDLDQIGEILVDGETALLVEPNDSGELVNAIDKLAQDKSLRIRIANKARMEVAKKYTWKMNVKQVIGLLPMKNVLDVKGAMIEN